ncbi:uncharacterized protein LOC144870234 [Branchiostoma floridae x Branchiostoma japonicum]
MFKVLNYFGFGESLIKWISVLYNNISSKVINNGHISDAFPLLRGVRQGCPLSPYLFILCVELLATKIRTNEHIKGLKIHTLETKVSQFADDSNFPLQPEAQSLVALVEDLKNFSIISGLKPNFDKCTILRIGSLKNTTFSLPCDLPIKWTNGPVQLLGIMLGLGTTGYTEKLDQNYWTKLAKIDKILLPWRGHSLTLFGKIALVNSLIVSQFTYLFMALPSPSAKFFKEYEKKIFNFIWNGRPEKIKRKVIYNTYDCGGLKLIHLPTFDLTRKASWIPRLWQAKTPLSKYLTDFPDPVCKLYPFLQLSKYHIDCIFTKFSRSVSPFFINALKAWLSFQFKPPETHQDIQSQLLWLNSNITIDSKPIHFRKQATGQIVFISDLLDTNGKFLSYKELSLKFGKTLQMMEYNQIISAIPSTWKRHLKDKPLTIGPNAPFISNYSWLGARKINKDIYMTTLLTNNVVQTPVKIQTYWEEILDIIIPWKQVFRLIYKTTICPRLRFFQFRMLHKFLPTRKMLYIWKLSDSPICIHCGNEQEDTLHLFWECPRVSQFWRDVKKWHERVSSEPLHIDLASVILGDLTVNSPRLNNTLILMAKFFIYKQQEKHLSLNHFISYIKTSYKLEFIIASRKNKLAVHYSKWGEILHIIS